MQSATLNISQYMASSAFTSAFALAAGNQATHNAGLHTPGLIDRSALTLSYSGLVVTANVAGMGFVFASGVHATGIGTTAGATSTSYSADFTSLVPGSGTVEAYLVAEAATVAQNPITIVGPPPGHPDYDPNFAPYTAYQMLVDTVAVIATTTAPDNATMLELGRVLLTSGETSIVALDTSHSVVASAVLAPTGIAAGTYTTPATLTVGADGRVIAITPGNQRLQLTGNTTLYVSTTGSDSNPGTSTQPFATLQHAWNYAMSSLDLAGYSLTIQIATAGTYAGLSAFGMPLGAAGRITIDAASTATVANTAGPAVYAANDAYVYVTSAISLSSPNSVAGGLGCGLVADFGGRIDADTVTFDACGDNHILALPGGKVSMLGSYTVAGGATTAHWQAKGGQIAIATGLTLTLTGTPAFSGAFAYTNTLGCITCAGVTFSGSASGPRYSAIQNSVIYTNGAGATYLPGSASGSATTGQYD